MDILEHADVNEIVIQSGIANIADDLHKRLIKYGRIDKTNNYIRKSSNTKKKYKSQNLDLNYYDKGDKFIDDDEDDEQGQGMQMQLCEVFYDDFVCFNGGTINFYQSEYY